jgi:hypothetical protein
MTSKAVGGIDHGDVPKTVEMITVLSARLAPGVSKMATQLMIK